MSLAAHASRVSPQSEPAIDLVHLARQTMDDPALEIELLEMFERQSARLVEQLKQCDPADVVRRSEIAHKLRGSALALGATRVASAARAFEDCCARGDSRSERLIPALEAAVSEARAEIAGLTR